MDYMAQNNRKTGDENVAQCVACLLDEAKFNLQHSREVGMLAHTYMPVLGK